MSELHQGSAGEQDRGHDLRNQRLPAAVHHQRGRKRSFSLDGFSPLMSASNPPSPPTTGGQHEPGAGAGERRGPLPVRPSAQLHRCGDGERRAVRRHRHRLLWAGPGHLPQHGGDAPPADGPVQLQMAQRYHTSTGAVLTNLIIIALGGFSSMRHLAGLDR